MQLTEFEWGMLLPKFGALQTGTSACTPVFWPEDCRFHFSLESSGNHDILVGQGPLAEVAGDIAIERGGSAAAPKPAATASAKS